MIYDISSNALNRVYCNCFETGNLKEVLPFHDLIFVSADGSLDCLTKDFDLLCEFQNWRSYRACEHTFGILVYHRIGNT